MIVFHICQRKKVAVTACLSLAVYTSMRVYVVSRKSSRSVFPLFLDSARSSPNVDTLARGYRVIGLYAVAAVKTSTSSETLRVLTRRCFQWRINTTLRLDRQTENKRSTRKAYMTAALGTAKHIQTVRHEFCQLLTQPTDDADVIFRKDAVLVCRHLSSPDVLGCK